MAWGKDSSIRVEFEQPDGRFNPFDENLLLKTSCGLRGGKKVELHNFRNVVFEQVLIRGKAWKATSFRLSHKDHNPMRKTMLQGMLKQK